MPVSGEKIINCKNILRKSNNILFRRIFLHGADKINNCCVFCAYVLSYTFKKIHGDAIENP